MPRKARIIVPDIPHHITQRGNRKSNVFFTLKDYQQYLSWLNLYSGIYRFDIIAYCLMPNHVHLIGTPRQSNSVSRTMQIVQMMYTQMINHSKGLNGHLWHSRYYSTPLDDTHLWHAIRYVEQNPVRAGLVKKAEDYRWSSAAFHCGLRDDKIISRDFEIKGTFDDWINVLRQIPDSETLEMIRQKTFRGIPCGDKKFSDRISRKTGIDFMKPVMGRPRKAHK